jgi:hypothetical protein
MHRTELSSKLNWMKLLKFNLLNCNISLLRVHDYHVLLFVFKARDTYENHS